MSLQHICELFNSIDTTVPERQQFAHNHRRDLNTSLHIPNTAFYPMYHASNVVAFWIEGTSKINPGSSEIKMNPSASKYLSEPKSL